MNRRTFFATLAAACLPIKAKPHVSDWATNSAKIVRNRKYIWNFDGAGNQWPQADSVRDYFTPSLINANAFSWSETPHA